jgi:hypothetical protein
MPWAVLVFCWPVPTGVAKILPAWLPVSSLQEPLGATCGTGDAVAGSPAPTMTPAASAAQAAIFRLVLMGRGE